MDERIEVINENMMVVDFGLLPLDGIEYTPYELIDPKSESGRVSDEGILVLNSKHKGFKLLKDNMVQLIPLDDKKLKSRQNKLLKKAKTDMDKLKLCCIDLEFERREKKRKYEHESQH